MIGNMKRDMKTYLAQEYPDESQNILVSQEKIYQDCVSKITGKSNSQKKTMKNTILPRLALYKALQENGFSSDEAKNITYDYTEYKAVSMLGKIKKMDCSLPFFFGLLKTMFTIGLKGDNWKTEKIVATPNMFSFDIVDCLWYNTCIENDCPELCSIFCDTDYFFYGNLTKIGFEREHTIAQGDGKCDFCFLKKDNKKTKN